MRFPRTSIASQFLMNWRISALSISLIFNESWSRELWIMNYELWIMSYELWVMNYEVWVRGKVVKLKYFPLWRDSSLCYASFRMTGLCFLLTIRNLYYWGIFFETQRFFFLNCFLSELSWRNSFAMKRCGEGWRMRGKVDESWRRKLWVMSYELWVMSYECGVKS